MSKALPQGGRKDRHGSRAQKILVLWAQMGPKPEGRLSVCNTTLTQLSSSRFNSRTYTQIEGFTLFMQMPPHSSSGCTAFWCFCWRVLKSSIGHGTPGASPVLLGHQSEAQITLQGCALGFWRRHLHFLSSIWVAAR